MKRTLNVFRSVVSHRYFFPALVCVSYMTNITSELSGANPVPAVPAAAQAATPRSMKIEDLYRFQRVADPQVRPQGDWVVYQVSSVDLAANKTSTSLWLAALDGKTPPRQLTNSQGKSDRHPRWSPDGSKILFESSRSGSNQLWVIDIAGGEAKQITNLSTGASTAIWSHDGQPDRFRFSGIS
jgi:Tol biopolymer transport system component